MITVVVVIVHAAVVLTSGESAAVATALAHMGGDLVVTVTRGGTWCVVTLSAGSQRGDMELDLVSAVRGCSLSGERARRSSGDPGSDVLHGRPNDELADVFLLQPPAGPSALDTVEQPAPGVDNRDDGLYDCVVFELPGWWPDENVSGLGERVGDCGRGDGDGVRANGDSGMCPTDLRRLGEWRFLVAECSLCLSPCNVDGRCDGVGELGVTVGDEFADELDELVDEE